jgi:hypothetical protein
MVAISKLKLQFKYSDVNYQEFISFVAKTWPFSINSSIPFWTFFSTFFRDSNSDGLNFERHVLQQHLHQKLFLPFRLVSQVQFQFANEEILLS